MGELGVDAFLDSRRHLLQQANISEAEFRSKFQRWVGVGKELPVEMAMHLMGHLVSSVEMQAMAMARNVSFPGREELEARMKNGSFPEIRSFDEAAAALNLTINEGKRMLAEGHSSTDFTQTKLALNLFWDGSKENTTVKSMLSIIGV